MTSTDDLRSAIREAVLHAECERPEKCPDCITDSVLAVVAGRVERSARAAQDCGKATASLIDLFHAALRAHQTHGADAAVKVLLDHGEQVPEFLDGLDLPAPAPVSELLGAAPDWLGGQSVDDYVRHTRRA